MAYTIRGRIARSIAKIKPIEELLTAARREVCCQIAQIMEYPHNNLVESVKLGKAEITFEEAMEEEGFTDHHGNIYPLDAEVTLFIKRKVKGSKPKDWGVKPFRLGAMCVELPEEGQRYRDEVVAKFSLLGRFLDSKGNPTTLSSSYINCVLIERHEGTCPEFMLEEEYWEFLKAQRVVPNFGNPA